MRSSAFAALALALCQCASSYKPVIMLHGIDDNAAAFDDMKQWIEGTHPGTPTYALDVFEGEPASWISLSVQVDGVSDAIRKVVASDPSSFADGYHLVCHSQGALICRCVIEAMDDHNVHTFISMAGPQGGVYGPDYFSFLPSVFQTLTADEIYRLAYESWAQKTISVANMWNDPKRQDEFLAGNTFLPMYNGLVGDATTFKANFLRLERGVFLVGDQSALATGTDGGIEPWQSGAWGYLNSHDYEDVVEMESMDFYQKDTFGLRTLDESGRLVIMTPANVSHAAWIHDQATVEAYVIPQLD
mmetsp:Transcript_4902/g.8072  ORF Transcript_4902/g.8072 Transcript_4902/m.8072 type:complete len:302 (+) Transcript_4902:80-985(+)